jgi:hypothetical protein
LANNSYRRGTSFERRLVTLLKPLGWCVARSASSHSAVDVWAVSGEAVLLLQAKTGARPSPSDYAGIVQQEVPESVVKAVLWRPPRHGAPLVVLWQSAPLPASLRPLGWVKDREQTALRLPAPRRAKASE